MPKTYLEHMKERLQGHEKNVPSVLGSKANVRLLAKMLGVRVPEIYFQGFLDDIPWDKLPDSFVFKPEFASTSIGVFLVETNENGSWVDAVTREELSKELIISKSRETLERYSKSANEGKFVIEQLLRSHTGSVPPADVRVYGFFGELGMIYVDDHLSGEVAISSYYDGNFEPFEDLEERYAIHPSAANWQRIVQAEPTPNAELIKNIARRISLAVPTAFCRVDLYDTPDGVFLGEITFYPGAFYYKEVKLMLPKEDLRLGQLWDAAITRLQNYDLQPVPQTLKALGN